MKILTYACLMLCILSGFLFSACSDDNDQSEIETRRPIELSQQTRATAGDLLEFYVNFTIDMAKSGDADIKNENIAVSPISAAMVFAMTANGIEGSNQKEYLEYLGTSDLNALNSLCASLISQLPEADKKVSLNLANSIWANKCFDHNLSQDYVSDMNLYFNAEIQNMDFMNDYDNTLLSINNWCASKTGGIIETNFKNLNTNTLVMLLNAMSFKAPWNNKIFDASLTKADIFHGSKGDSEVMMMESEFYQGDYTNDGDFEYFNIKFGNKAFYMEIVLPAENMSIQEATEKLSYERMLALRKEITSTFIKTYMPKFSIKNNCDINKMFEATNRREIINNLDFTMFSPQINGNICFSQSTSISVDESGAVAASVTSGDIPIIALPVEDKVTVKIDRPFFFFINEYSTGACIVSGRITNI